MATWGWERTASRTSWPRPGHACGRCSPWFRSARATLRTADGRRSPAIRPSSTSSRSLATFQRKGKPRSYARFRERAAAWIDDYALFAALRTASGGQPWNRWDREVRLRRPGALARARRELAEDVDFHLFQQWAFDEQWRSFKRHCEDLGVALIGDVPFFVAYDSADVWAHRDLFELDGEGRPTVVAGVPPDFFS